MPNYLTAKDIAQRALQVVGRLSPSQQQANAAELRVSMQWLDMFLTTHAGSAPMAGLWNVIDIPLEAGIGDYDLSDFTDENGAQHIFSVNLVSDTGDVNPLEMLFESQSVTENLSDTGTPIRCVVTRDVLPVLKVYPTPTQNDQDSGLVLRVRFQSYTKAIDPTGIADIERIVRPSWALWAVKGVAYEIGCGPVLRLPENELNRLEKDRDRIERLLMNLDAKYNAATPPVTQPYDY